MRHADKLIHIYLLNYNFWLLHNTTYGCILISTNNHTRLIMNTTTASLPTEAAANKVTSKFIDNGNETITHVASGLIFTKKTLRVDVNHKTAEEAAASFGEGFRLPTPQEFLVLVEYDKHGPAIDTEFFPDTANDWYWTSTPCAWNSSAVWVVDFSVGSVSYYYRDFDACVRAVCSSQ